MPTTVTLPTTLTNGATADATEVMGDLNAIVTRWNADVATIAGTLVGTSDTQTLTNKTLTSPKINENVALTSSATELNLLDGVTALVTTSTTDTFTNKRITKRITTSASAATHTIDSDTTDVFTVTAQAEATAFANPSGTPTNGQGLVIRIKDNGTARAITWSGSYWRAIGVTLPTTTVLSKTLYIGALWNSADTKWDVIATCQEV